MQPQRTTLALPADSLADISTELGEALAGNLLATWTALWDPALVVRTQSIPAAKSLDSLAEAARDPQELVLVPAITNSGTADPWESHDPLVLHLPKYVRRMEVVLHLDDLLSLQHPLGGPHAADFYAFGFAYLEVELLTRSMHYDSQVAQDSLRQTVVAAANAAVGGDQATLDAKLSDAYDLLMQSRNHYYPIDFYLIDLMLTAPSVIGRPLAEACRGTRCSNLLLTGNLLEQIASHEPDTLRSIREAFDDKRLTVCGGTMTDEPLQRLSPESLLAEFRSGVATFEEHLGRRPRIMAHPAGPIAPLVPGMLHKLGYHAAVLADFQGGTVPRDTGSRTTWTGLDHTPIEALAAEPIDMGSNAAMLALAKKMQYTMNYDLAASLLLVGWPGHRTEWHGDLMQVASRSSILGRPMTLDEYFDVTTSQDYASMMPAEAYPSATQAVGEPPQAASTRWATLAGVAGAAEPSAESLAQLLTVADADQTAGTLWLNASSVAREHRRGEFPAFGWRWEPTADAGNHAPRCEPGVLRNEHLEVAFDDRTGGVSATRLHAHRGNHLSQHLVVEPLGPQGIAAGLQLAFEGWQVVEAGATSGTLASCYRVVDRDGHTLANVRQLTSLAEHQKSLDFVVEYEPLRERASVCRMVSRIAVRDEDFALTRGLQGIDLPTSKSQVTATWLGVGGEPVPLAVIGSKPRVHRRHSGRMLDTRLIEAAGENTSVDLSYVLDCRYPAAEFAIRREPQSVVALAAAAARQVNGWWLQLGAKNVLATCLVAEPIERELLVRMRLLETAGRPVQSRLAAWRAIVDARQLNFLGEPDQQLNLQDGMVQLSMAPYEFVEIELLLSDGP